MAHPIAEFRAALTPPLTASAPPVKNPAMTFDFGTSAQAAGGCLGRDYKRTCVVWVFLFADALDGAVKSRKQACHSCQRPV